MTSAIKLQRFKSDIHHYQVPSEFNYPFYYDVDPLCLLAAKELQHYLLNQQEWQHDFQRIGKMFGVLVVETSEGKLGYLAAFSGKLANSNNWSIFVPAIFDMLDEHGFYKKGEEELNILNETIFKAEHEPLLAQLKQSAQKEKELADFCLSRERQRLKIAKKKRKEKRTLAKPKLSQADYQQLEKKLIKESLGQQYHFKRLKNYWILRLANNRQLLDAHLTKIERLKLLRQQKSAQLQKQLFTQYQFLNIKGESKSVEDIFAQTALKTPPSGAGECAAPKLLQYAFQNQLKPIALAEFWWGKSPSSAIRKHAYFYPACKGKCEPILGYMLQGMKVAKNPLLRNPAENKTIEIIYEDEALALIHKPENMLSVPGKYIKDSVATRIKIKYPHARGALVVHRLDMSTSGLMLIAKTEEVHKHLQHQFIKRKIKKRYLALLDGDVEGNEGVIDLPLIGDYNDRPRQIVCFQTGKPARTIWKVIDRQKGQTKIHFFPVTGRTHQLRVHAAHSMGLNSPIIGDDLYGKKDRRLYLHAAAIEFEHPISKKWMQFEIDTDF